MRRVFVSQRIENAEAVAALLHEHGIQTRVSNGRGWRGAIRGNFSYREKAANPDPAEVWVVFSADQPEARRLLREAGLMPDTRNVRDSFVGPTVHGGDTGRNRSRSRGNRLRIGLLLAVIAGVGLVWYSQRPSAPSAAPQATLPTATPSSDAAMRIVTAPAPYPAAMPTTLATLLVDSAREGAAACVSIDGADPGQDWRAQWPDGAVHAASTCPDDLQRIAVGDYRTDGSGVGTARADITAPNGTVRSRRLQVERRGMDWRILDPAPPAH